MRPYEHSLAPAGEPRLSPLYLRECARLGRKGKRLRRATKRGTVTVEQIAKLTHQVEQQKGRIVRAVVIGMGLKPGILHD